MKRAADRSTGPALQALPALKARRRPPPMSTVAKVVIDGFVVYGTLVKPKHVTEEQIARAVADADLDYNP